MDPLISIRIRNPAKAFQPGEVIQCEYQIDAVEPDEILAVEASILWWTDGKGDQDLGVHYFERRVSTDAVDGDLRPLRRFQAVLPNSPFSYWGRLVQIRWCARVRAFLRKGRTLSAEQAFNFGNTDPHRRTFSLPQGVDD